MVTSREGGLSLTIWSNSVTFTLKEHFSTSFRESKTLSNLHHMAYVTCQFAHQHSHCRAACIHSVDICTSVIYRQQ